MAIAIILDDEMMKLAGNDGIAVWVGGTESINHTPRGCDAASESGHAASDVGAHDAFLQSKM